METTLVFILVAFIFGLIIGVILAKPSITR